MVQTISDLIFQDPVIDLQHNFSSREEIDTFFKNLPPQTVAKWPLNLKNIGFKTKYLSAIVIPETWKSEAYFLLQAEVYNHKQKAIIEQSFQFTDNGNLVIDICSVHKEQSEAYPQKMKIARYLSESNFQFLSAYDKKIKPNKPSYIQIHASSELTKQNIRTYGGYVWANNGFDFANPQELKMTREAFKGFLRRYKIQISDKNLQLFTKPCHFAAYSCGFLINVNGRLHHIGKAFLFQHSWRGIMKTSSANSTERKYAHAYYTEPLPALRRKSAFRTLSKKYRHFIRNNYKKALLSRISYRFKTIRRLLSFKFIQRRFR